MCSGNVSRMLPMAVAVCLFGVDCFGQMIGQAIPDGAAIEVRRQGQVRHGVVRGYASGEYRVEYGGGAFDSEWIPEADVFPVAAPAVNEPKEFDLAPLYRSIGAAMCPLALVMVVVILIVTRTFRRRPDVPFPPGPFPPSQSS